MKRIIFCAATIAGILGFAAVANAEVTQSSQRGLIVKYGDRSRETYSVKYSGHIDVDKSESGGPSTWKHPFDDRQCHWSISTYVQRDVCLVSKTGSTYCKGDFSTVYNTSTQNRGSTLIVTKLRSENCGDANDRFLSDVNNARQGLAAAFPQIVAKDFAAVRNELKVKVNAVSVVPQ